MDVAALVLFILAAITFIPHFGVPIWVPWCLLTVGFICQYTTVTDQLVNL